MTIKMHPAFEYLNHSPKVLWIPTGHLRYRRDDRGYRVLQQQGEASDLLPLDQQVGDGPAMYGKSRVEWRDVPDEEPA